MNNLLRVLFNAVSLTTLLFAVEASAQTPFAVAGRDNVVIATLHAEGAQIYECKPDSGGSAGQARALAWQFREPIATLMVDGKSIGRHYAGPNWDHVDGSGVKGKVSASAPGAANDIAQLQLDVVEHRGVGVLANATIVQRLNTKGGVLHGACESAGSFRSVPYSADYIFLHKAE
jgi:Protein of unknown function (DUF3455)